MVRYWFEFDLTRYENPPRGFVIGCGVTELSAELAMARVKKVFANSAMPPILKCIENVDISTLDAGHIRSNMGSPTVKGIWFPLGYH